MPGFKFGVGFFPTGPLQRMLTLVKLSEDMGFSCAYVGDSQMIWREPYVILGAAAMVNEPWITLLMVSLAYLISVPFSLISYSRVKRRRATRLSPLPAASAAPDSAD